MPSSKKTIYLLNVNGFSSEITDLTYPLIQGYADKIGANVHIITERKFPDWPVVYEKLQIGEIAREIGSDWNIYIDSDTLIHPNAVDYTELIGKDTVLHNGADFGPIRWTWDNYFRRDGRHIGSCNWLTIASDWCLDLWTPLEMSLAEAISNIHPTTEELKSGVIDREHLIDDYTLSRNIARYGLHFKTIGELLKEIGMESGFFWHQYTLPTDAKLVKMRDVLEEWDLP